MVTKWMGDRYVLGFVLGPEISPESNSVQTLQKPFGRDYKPRCSVCMHMQKDYIRMLEIL